MTTLMADDSQLVNKAKQKYQKDATIEFDEDGNVINNSTKFVSTGNSWGKMFTK